MKGLITTVGALGAAVVVTVASGDVTLTPMEADIGPFENLGALGGYGVSNLVWPNATEGPVLYDNTVGPSVGFFDWINPAYSWADDLHRISAGGAGAALVTGINYAYFNTGGFGFTVTHTILIYDMTPPSGTHGNSSIPGFSPIVDAGALLASISVGPLAGTGPFSVAVGGLSIALPGSAVWISFQESAPSPTFAGPTFWLSGGVPVVGNSHYTLGAFYPGGRLHYPHALSPYGPSNIMLSLTGQHIPGPPVILAMGLGGLAVLARRRRK